MPLVLSIAYTLVFFILISALLGYGRRISLIPKIVGWLVVIAMIVLPIYLIVGERIPMTEMSADRRNDSAAPSAAPAAETQKQAKRKPAPERAKTQPMTPPTASPKIAPNQVGKSNGSNDIGVTAMPMDAPSPPATAADDEQDPIAESAGEMAAPAPNEAFDKVDVFFGTNRERQDKRLDGGVFRVSFNQDRANNLTLGRAVVTIPKTAHTEGIVERPWELRVWGVRIAGVDEDPAKHFTLHEVGIMTREQFLDSVRAKLQGSDTYKKQAFIFVHGYNVAFDAALYRTAQIVYDLRFDGVPFVYSWPSAGGYASYEYDQQSTRQARPYLTEFLKLVIESSGAEQVHLVAHSMGNDALLEAVRELSFTEKPEFMSKINQIILAAPDVDRNVFETLAKKIISVARGVTLYASANDKALIASRTYAGGVPRAGDVLEDGPLIIDGMDSIDVSNTSTDFFGLNHNSYAEATDILEDISKLMRLGVRPPDARLAKLRPVESPNGTYWRYLALDNAPN